MHVYIFLKKKSVFSKFSKTDVRGTMAGWVDIVMIVNPIQSPLTGRFKRRQETYARTHLFLSKRSFGSRKTTHILIAI